MFRTSNLGDTRRCTYCKPCLLGCIKYIKITLSVQQCRPVRDGLNRNKGIEPVHNYDTIKNDKQFKVTVKTIYTPDKLILRNLFKSHWVIIFLNEVLDGALTTLL